MAGTPTARELSAPYANFMVNPLSPGSENVCTVCLQLTSAGYPTCFQCGHHDRYADAVLPVSYSVHGGQFHLALAGYKRDDAAGARQLKMQLAAVLWRFVRGHERCLARKVGVERFEVVTTVPSGSPERDDEHPLRRIVGHIVGDTRDRYERLLVRSEVAVEARTVHPAKYDPTRQLDGEAVLLVDDTWTTGASVESAAGALKVAGGGPVGVIVLGRHVRQTDGDNATRLRAMRRPFSWDRCAFE